MVERHNRLSDLLAPAAIGALDEPEMEMVAEHADECLVCESELAVLFEGAEVLALGVVPVAPPDRLRSSLMGTVHREASLRVIAADPGPRSLRLWRRPRIFGAPRFSGGALAAGGLASLLAAVVLSASALTGGFGFEAPPMDGPSSLEAVALSGGLGAPGARGEAIRVGDGSVLVSVSGLPPAPKGHGYVLWRVSDGVPRSMGLLSDPRDGGRASAVVRRSQDDEQIAITLEERGKIGPGPSSDPVLRASLSSLPV